MSDRYAHALYCDDIRQEANGKVMFLGCYQSDLIIYGKPPTVLPKLCVNIWVVTPTENPFKSLHVKLLHGEKEIASANVHAEKHGDRPQSGDRPRMSIVTQVVLSPFQIEKEGTLRAMVEADGETLRAGGLIIRFDPTHGGNIRSNEAEPVSTPTQ